MAMLSSLHVLFFKLGQSCNFFICQRHLTRMLSEHRNVPQNFDETKSTGNADTVRATRHNKQECAGILLKPASDEVSQIRHFTVDCSIP